MPDADPVCVVTHPLGSAGETATRSLLDVLTAITSVSLLTAGVDDGSPVLTENELAAVVDYSVGQPSDSVPIAAVQFLLGQVRIAAAIARRDEPIVLFYGATSYLLPIVVARLLGRTVVLEPRGDVPLTLRLHWEERLPTPVARTLAGSVWALERLGYRIADAIVTYTPSMASELDLEGYGPKLHTDGARYVDTERFRPTTAYEDRERVVGFLGRLDEEKGIRTLAAVATELPDDVIFRFVGDGELRQWLESALADEIDRGTVEVPGWIDHDRIPAELNRFRLLVLPSQPTEGLPTVILESLACGTPVYATPVSGTSDVVVDGETGFRIDSDDPGAMRDEIAEILQRDDLEAISENGRALIEEEYSFESAVERYRRILGRLSGDRRSR